MAGMSDPNLVDLITYDPSRDEIAVIMIADTPWSDAAVIEQMVAKLDAYVHFIKDGSLVRRFPHAIGKSIRIQIDCASPPSGRPAAVIAQAQKLLSDRGIGIAVNVIMH